VPFWQIAWSGSRGYPFPTQEVIGVADLERLKARAAEIAEKESKVLLDRTPGSKALHERAVKSLPSGVASNFQVGHPYPVYLKRGQGSKVWDVDGTEYTDFHGGFGVNVVGHAHPKIVEAIRKVADQGIHFAVSTETTVALAEEICSRFQLEQMRFVNSGTEATMDSLGVARAATGRDKVIKMEGSYHGHHDSLLFSVVPEADVLGLRHNVDHEGKAWYTTEPTSKGIPRALWDTVIVVPFNDADAVEEALADNEGEVAAVILEPVMMNIGIVVPKPGYLQALRDACEYLGKLGTMLAEGCQRAMDEHDIPGHTMDLGAKGCVSYRTEPLTNYRDFLETVPELFYASFSWMINRGLFMTPGDEEQWTISVQHTEDDIQTYIDAFGEFCQELTS
jgi:glutamate-1-semialdehyde 2,1-aminomutase